MLYGKAPINKFYDLNKLPPEEGILVFPISMSRISTGQSAKKCFEYMKIFIPDKSPKQKIGLNFIYGDLLYFNSTEKSSKLKKSYMPLLPFHKNSFLKIISKKLMYVEEAFSFQTWSQIMLEAKNFVDLFGKLKKKYKSDKKLQKYVKEDINKSGKRVTENQVNFILEETLLFYLIVKGQVNLRNDFIQGHEKWILWCYPGKPLKSQIYLTQKNFFDFENEENKYEKCFYNLEEKKLYDFDRVDLETLEL